MLEIEINDVVHWSWEAPIHLPQTSYKVEHVPSDGSSPRFDSGEPSVFEGIEQYMPICSINMV